MKMVIRARWMLMLALTLVQTHAVKTSAAETSATDTPPDAPSLELLDFLGSMVESTHGELIGPETLDEAETAETAEPGQWISRDASSATSDKKNSPTRKWSGDNLFEKESTDE